MFDIRVGAESGVNPISENPVKKTGPERSPDFKFSEFFRIGADSGFLIFLMFPDRSGFRIFNFSFLFGAERTPDFYF